MTQHELAEKSGLRQATVSALENGRSKAHPGTIQALANALETEVEVIREGLALSEPVNRSAESHGGASPQSVKPSQKEKPVNESTEPSELGELGWNWNNAKRAAAPHARQWKEAMMFLDPILKKHPEFLEARQLMRTAELQAQLKIPLSDRIPPPQSYVGKARKKIDQGSFFEAMELLEEKVFVYLPANIKANVALHDAALGAGLSRTARYALEFAAEKNPEDTEILRKLADYYQQIGELDDACAVLKQFTIIAPDDLEVAKARRDMMARASMSGGKVEIKDRDQRVEGELRERFAMTSEQKRSEIGKLVQEYERIGRKEDDASPEAREAREGLRRAVSLAKELGETSLEDLEHAVELQHLLVEAFPQDPVLVTQLDELRVLLSKMRLDVAEAKWSESAHQQAADAAPGEELERLRQEKVEIQLDSAERAAQANPTSAQAQLNLGKILALAGRHRDAVKPLQKAKKDPRDGIDVEAMALLADCFVAGNLHQLAVKEIDEALAKLDERGNDEADLQWKELKYRQALILDQTDRKEEALQVFAEIYAKDSEFRDVDQRVWGGE